MTPPRTTARLNREETRPVKNRLCLFIALAILALLPLAFASPAAAIDHGNAPVVDLRIGNAPALDAHFALHAVPSLGVLVASAEDVCLVNHYSTHESATTQLHVAAATNLSRLPPLIALKAHPPSVARSGT